MVSATVRALGIGVCWSLASCGSHAAEDRLPDPAPTSPTPSDGRSKTADEAKDDTSSGTDEGDLASRLRKDGEATSDTAGAAGQEEGICGTRLSLDVESKGRTVARYVLVARVSPSCAEGNDVLVSLKAGRDVRLLSADACEPSAVPAYDLMCRVPAASLVRDGMLTLPVSIDGNTVPPGGAGDARFDFRFLPRVSAYAEFVPADAFAY